MAQMRAPVIALLVVLAVGLFANSEAQKGCCTRYSIGRMPIDRIRGYSIQTIKNHCNIDAIIFHTIQQRKVCVDPAKDWVMVYIRNLRENAERLHKKMSHG
ncbi:hypothetical protein DPEC_G00059860 [Dallia pectoralis]|uniref:Uncharacterized protein n=1 Tax=Dallia pectoralis TaxID=75939 RepID=A0ACC2H6H3_DALPE|nr:hypothetical protein DPEC_G00059860 [Dallia pectoralis]